MSRKKATAQVSRYIVHLWVALFFVALFVYAIDADVGRYAWLAFLALALLVDRIED